MAWRCVKVDSWLRCPEKQENCGEGRAWLILDNVTHVMQSDIKIVTLSKFLHIALALQSHYSLSIFKNYRLSKAVPTLCVQNFVSLPSDTISSSQLLNSSNSKSGIFSHQQHIVLLYCPLPSCSIKQEYRTK